jgi:hypothetical protein
MTCCWQIPPRQVPQHGPASVQFAPTGRQNGVAIIGGEMQVPESGLQTKAVPQSIEVAQHPPCPLGAQATFALPVEQPGPFVGVSRLPSQTVRMQPIAETKAATTVTGHTTEPERLTDTTIPRPCRPRW